LLPELPSTILWSIGECNRVMRQFGKVDIPQEAFIQALKMDS
jgi:translation elongation factor EF-4